MHAVHNFNYVYQLLFYIMRQLEQVCMPINKDMLAASHFYCKSTYQIGMCLVCKVTKEEKCGNAILLSSYFTH